MFVAQYSVGNTTRVSPPVATMAEAKTLALKVHAWAKEKGVAVRSVLVRKATDEDMVAPATPAPAVVEQPAAPAAPAKRSRSRKAAGGAA